MSHSSHRWQLQDQHSKMPDKQNKARQLAEAINENI